MRGCVTCAKLQTRQVTDQGSDWPGHPCGVRANRASYSVAAASVCGAGKGLGLPWEMRWAMQTAVGFQQKSPKSPHV